MNRRSFLYYTAAFAGGLALTPTLQAAGWAEGAKLPALDTFGLEGTLPNTTGKVVYLDFWASWCAPCKASFPVLAGWHKDYASRGLLVLGVNVDEELAAMKAFLAKNTVGFPVVRDAAHKLVAAANVDTMPTSFLIDRKGVIRLVHNGFHEKDKAPLQAKIESLLAES
ncbi:TlpA disulfide reductase family protein [soil metagenome]